MLDTNSFVCVAMILKWRSWTQNLYGPFVIKTFASDVLLLGLALRKLDAQSENPGLKWSKQQLQLMQKHNTEDS